MWLWALAGCLSADRIAEEQQVAGQAVVDVVALSLVATELLAHAADEPTTETPPTGRRHSGECGCPCIERVGTSDSYVQELDYEQPFCVPWSGLLPALVGGHVWLDVDRGDIGSDRSELSVGEHDLELDVDGTWSGDPSAWSATLSGTLGVGPTATVLSGWTIEYQTTGLLFWGEAQVGDRSWVFDDLTLEPDVLSAPCVVPSSGHADDGDGAEVHFDGEGTRVGFRGHETRLAPCDLSAAFIEG